MVDIDAAARKYAVWSTVVPSIGISALAAAGVTVHLVAARGTYPPSLVTGVLRLAAASSCMGLVLAALDARSYRRQCAERVEVSLTSSYAQRVNRRPLGRRLQWSAVLVVLLLSVQGEAYLQGLGAGELFWLASPVGLAGLLWPMSLTYWQIVAIRREVLAKKVEVPDVDAAV
jgi:hypothetical protein